MRYIFIDPSVNTIGIVVFTENGDLADFFGITTPRKLNWMDRVSHAVDRILLKFGGSQVSTRILIEMPIYFSGGRGKYAYAGEKIQKLYYTVGGYRESLRVKGFDVELIKVSEARKNIPKKVSQRRVERVFGHITDNEHILDAIYMGMWYGKKHDLWDLST